VDPGDLETLTVNDFQYSFVGDASN